MDVNELKEILQVLDERKIAEFELEKEGIKLRVRRAGAESGQPPQVTVVSSEAALPAAAAPAAPPAAPAEAAEAPEEEGITILRSPIVSTSNASMAPTSIVSARRSAPRASSSSTNGRR